MQPVELTSDEKRLLEKSIPEYLDAIYPPEIPRAFDVHRLGCPVCGDGIKKHGKYSWIMDPAKPFKLQCPECKSIFPDNDFYAYWKSGFKDKSLLTGKIVDDGRGWRPKPNEPKYWFVAYYAHWVHYRDNNPEPLVEAYRRTGEPGFARRILAILDKYAERYPDYDYNTQSRYAEEILSSYNGRVLNAIWETFFARRMATAYYQVMHFLDGPDAELEQALGKSTAQIKRNIEENMLRVMAHDVMSGNGKNNGNFGMHQTALLAVAKCLHDDSMLKWVTDFRQPANTHSIPLYYALCSNIFGDGAPMEAPGYNRLWLNNIGSIIQSLKENGVDAFKMFPTARRLFTYPAKLVVCGRFTPSTGDSGSLQNTGLFCAKEDALKLAFEDNPTPLTATLLWLNDKSNARAAELAIRDFGYSSSLLSAYGMATLQNGNPRLPTAVVLSFPAYVGHRHTDSLNLDFFAENVPLTPDFGYPDSASGDDPTRGPYLSNTLVHNTVVVNARKQERQPGTLLEYETGATFQRMAADCSRVYSETSFYRRSVTTVEVAPGKTVVFDVFRVKGGHQHDWFLHSCGEEFSWGQKLERQAGGTLAGEDVPYGVFYDSPEHEAMKTKSNRSYGGYTGSGYQFLTDVARGKALPGAPIVLPPASTPQFPAKEGAALKIYPLDEGETLFISHGLPPRTQGNPQKHLVFVTRRREAQDENLESTFSTVWESTSNEIAQVEIAEVRPIPVAAGAAAARISFKDGSLLYLFDAETVVEFTCDGIAFSGHAGALLLAGTPRAYVAGPGSITCCGEQLVQSGEEFEARVAKVDIPGESITLDRVPPQELAGRFFRVGDYSYVADRIEGKTIFLRDQSTMRGRFRLLSYLNGSKREGMPVPGIVLARTGMSLYTREGEFMGRLEIDASRLKAGRDLELDTDYWVSECGEGDKVIFPSSSKKEN